MSDGDLLRLVQWLSPAFPVGGYAFSHGLEAEISAGRVRDAETAEAWVRRVVARGSGRVDAGLLAAMLAGGDPGALALEAEALAASRERAEETRALGAAFARAVAKATGVAGAAWPMPVAVGVAARDLDLAPERIVALYLQAFAGALVSAAVRFVPLGQGEGARVLDRLRDDILATAAAAVGDPAARASFAPGADLAAMEHETMETRIFRT